MALYLCGSLAENIIQPIAIFASKGPVKDWIILYDDCYNTYEYILFYI